MSNISVLKIGTDSYDIKDSTARSDITNLVSKDFIKLTRFSKSVTVTGNSISTHNLGSYTVPSGYTLIGIIPYQLGYADQWLVSLSVYGSNIQATIHSKHANNLTNNLIYYLVFIKTDFYNSILTT